MDSVKDYVEATLSLASAEKELLKDLCQVLGISEQNCKSISLKNVAKDTTVSQIIIVELVGTNRIKCKDISRIEGVTIVTPNTIEIAVGEFDL